MADSINNGQNKVETGSNSPVDLANYVKTLDEAVKNGKTSLFSQAFLATPAFNDALVAVSSPSDKASVRA